MAAHHTNVVNVKVAHIRKTGYGNLAEWCNNSNNIYIGRKGIVFINGVRFPKEDSKWANPFPVKRYGIAQAIYKYCLYLYESNLIKSIEELRGKTLGCWCVANSEIYVTCYGQVLIKQMRSKTESSVTLAGLEVKIAPDK